MTDAFQSAYGSIILRPVTHVRISEVTRGHSVERDRGNQGKNFGRKRNA